jgi:hypothetical protein
MQTPDIHVSDKGTAFIATIYDGAVKVDLSAATSKAFKFRRPNGTTFTTNANFLTNGQDSKLLYTASQHTEGGESVDDLNWPGIWQLQAILGFGSSTFRSNYYTFRVYRNL